MRGCNLGKKDKYRRMMEEDKISVWLAKKVTRNHTFNFLLKIPIIHINQAINIHIEFK